MALTPDDENIDSGPFKDWERRAIRRIIRNQERVDWAWSSARRWAFWITSMAAAFYAFYENVIEKFIWTKKP